MSALILETSSEKGCLVFAAQGKPVRSQFLCGPEFSTTLAVHVKEILAGERPSLIAIGIGPGSYTGIRVGASLGKALSFGWEIPLLGFCSLKAFGPPPVLVDARSQGVYALLDSEALLLSVSDPRICALSTIYSPHPEKLQKRLGPSKTAFQEVFPNPEHLAKIVFDQFERDGAIPFALEYLAHP